MGWEDNLIVNVLAEFDPHTHVRCGSMFLQSGCLRGRDNQLLGVHWAAGLATGKVRGRETICLLHKVNATKERSHCSCQHQFDLQ